MTFVDFILVVIMFLSGYIIGTVYPAWQPEPEPEPEDDEDSGPGA